jgi:hypothetical protein
VMKNKDKQIVIWFSKCLKILNFLIFTKS